jgi:hypothetical protein
VHFRKMLFATLPCFALFCVLYGAAQVPPVHRSSQFGGPQMGGDEFEGGMTLGITSPGDISKIGKRSSRKDQAPRAFRQYPGIEYEEFPLPPNYDEKTEWVFARLMYRAIRYGNWTIDYPRSDRHLSAAIRRLTRVHARPAEEPVALEDGDDVYNYPWLYAVEVGHWDLTDFEAAKLRDYLLRGGFFMVDDFHGTWEWSIFIRSMQKVFPDRQIVELPNDDGIFHTVYNLDDRYQVPGEQFVYSHRTYERDGYDARWRGIYDDKGRVMVAICHNMDLGDSWEHADNPVYPEQYSALGFRIGVDYVIYAMTH